MRYPHTRKYIRISVIIILLMGIYFYADYTHEKRELFRNTVVKLTPNCEQKLKKYALTTGNYYSTPYRQQNAENPVLRTPYSAEDIRAIQRGCNIIDDTQGQYAESALERWNATRYIRGNHTSCDHCHQGAGDKQGTNGDRLIGSLSLGASWSNGGDAYDRFTGLLLPFELRQMQCFINSSNGYKPNIFDDVIRDITAYSRFLSGAVNLQTQHRYPEQGIDEIPASATFKRGDDYVRGVQLYQQKCAHCHGKNGLGTVTEGKVIYPAVAGPNSFNRQSRNYFRFVSTILPGFICRNMPLGEENTLTNQDCRDIAFYIGNMPRPAGDREGPVSAAWQQIMMHTLPPLVELINLELINVELPHEEQANNISTQ
ncbi:MAG: c-type cytochrome [Ectothiorhodospiraceae bacterium]|nr:c-type cytochrome [Ectothiorhodospiraceae bacterium]